MIPELAWQTPIFHPNISATGVVCLGGYGTHWVPSLMIDELCHMLWDMIRYQNYDTESPYNRAAAVWAREQTEFPFPLDERPLRDQLTRTSSNNHGATGSPTASTNSDSDFRLADPFENSPVPPPLPDVQFLDSGPNKSAIDDGIENDNDILFID